MDKFSKNELYRQREEIVKLLKTTGRKDIDKLIKFLDKSNFFYSYGSYRHHKYVGGLAEHSLGVCKIALEENKSCERNSIIISALLHDICKVRYDFPKIYSGHGSKSISIIEDYVGFELTGEERRAIRFHMGKSRHLSASEIEEFNKAQTEELWYLIHTSDCLDCGNYPKTLRGPIKSFMSLLGL